MQRANQRSSGHNGKDFARKTAFGTYSKVSASRLLSPCKPRGCGAFTLVEIAMALGVFSFAILSIVGLLLTVTKTDSNAASDTVLAQMAETTVTQLKSRTYTSVHNDAALTDTEPDFYYNIAGRIARDANGIPVTVPAADSIYSCTVIRGTSSSPNLDYLILEFKWPVTAPAGNQKVQKLTTSFANYD